MYYHNKSIGYKIQTIIQKERPNVPRETLAHSTARALLSITRGGEMGRLARDDRGTIILTINNAVFGAISSLM